MKRLFQVFILQILLASCANATTPTIESTPQAVSTSTPAPFVPTLPNLIEPRVNGLADTPPEFTTGFGGEVKGISQAEIDYLVAWEVYQKMYRDEVGSNKWPTEVFVAEMLSYLDKKTSVDLIVQQDADTGRLLVALVKKVSNQTSVYWDFHNGAVANTNPMTISRSRLP